VQYDPPQYHVLDKRLFIEDLTQLFLSFHVLGRSRKNFQREISIIWEEGFTEVREFDALGVFYVELLNKCLDFGLSVMYLHL